MLRNKLGGWWAAAILVFGFAIVKAEVQGSELVCLSPLSQMCTRRVFLSSLSAESSGTSVLCLGHLQLMLQLSCPVPGEGVGAGQFCIL